MQDRSLEVLTRRSAFSEPFNSHQASHVVVQAIKYKISFKFGSVISD